MKLFLLFFLFSFSNFSKVDLKGRVLKSSKDKNIFLFNKGKEDGVHRKMNAIFYTEINKVCRAEVLKVSPSRSIWQVYREFDLFHLKKGSALKLKEVSLVKYIDDKKKKEGDKPDSVLSHHSSRP